MGTGEPGRPAGPQPRPDGPAHTAPGASACDSGAMTADADPPALSEATLDALDRASGRLASATLAAMEEQFAWFGRMPADQRASVLLIAQGGVAGFARVDARPLRGAAADHRRVPHRAAGAVPLDQPAPDGGDGAGGAAGVRTAGAAAGGRRGRAGRADRGGAALRQGDRVHLRHVLRVGGGVPRGVGRPAGGAGRRRHRPRRRGGGAAVARGRAGLGPGRGGDRAGRQPAVGRPADGGLRGAQPGGARRAGGAAVGAGFAAGRGARGHDRARRTGTCCAGWPTRSATARWWRARR